MFEVETSDFKLEKCGTGNILSFTLHLHFCVQLSENSLNHTEVI